MSESPKIFVKSQKNVLTKNHVNYELKKKTTAKAISLKEAKMLNTNCIIRSYYGIKLLLTKFQRMGRANTKP